MSVNHDVGLSCIQWRASNWQSSMPIARSAGGPKADVKFLNWAVLVHGAGMADIFKHIKLTELLTVVSTFFVTCLRMNETRMIFDAVLHIDNCIWVCRPAHNCESLSDVSGSEKVVRFGEKEELVNWRKGKPFTGRPESEFTARQTTSAAGLQVVNNNNYIPNNVI